MTSCTLEHVRQPAGVWNFAGCVKVDLGVGAHWGNPFHKKPSLNAKDCVGLATHLANASSLRSLRIPGLAGLHHTWEQPGIGAEGMRAIASALPSSLEKLEITGNAIGNDGAASLAAALKSRPLLRLRELNLELNAITDDGAAFLATVLGAAPLEGLNLDHNWIGADGATALAHGLGARGVTLQRLTLAGNNVGERGAAAFASALQSNQVLRSLNLYSNHIGTSGAVALAPVLRHSSLSELCLAYNYLDADGESTAASALANAMKQSASIRRLDLRWNHFSECRCGSRMDLRRAAASRPGLELLLEQRASSA